MSLDLFDIVDRTDTGLVRQTNEDAIGIHTALGLVLVADGMGGHAAGEVASQLAAEIVVRHVASYQPAGESSSEGDERLLSEAFNAANIAIRQTAKSIKDCKGMGTTVVAGLFRPGRLTFAHVGDSRLYRLRSNRLECLTTDHSRIQQVIRDGQYSNVAAARRAGVPENQLTRALGAGGIVQVDTNTTDLMAEDLYLFCSDGLYNMLGEEHIERQMFGGADDLDELADRLVEQACFNGGHDNMSLVLVRHATG